MGERLFMKQTRMIAAAVFLLLTAPFAQRPKTGSELLVAAAADLNPALLDIGQQFERKTGVRVKLSFGASGALTQQIQNGAPFDVFFSADMEYPKHLIADGRADALSL